MREAMQDLRNPPSPRRGNICPQYSIAMLSRPRSIDTDSDTRVAHCSTVTEIGIVSKRSSCSLRLFGIGKFGPTNRSSAFYVTSVFCLNNMVAVRRSMRISNTRLYRPSTKIRQSQGQCRERSLRRLRHDFRLTIRHELDPCPWRTPLSNKHFRRPCAHTPCRERW
jgi:hypothetical protein